MFKDIEIEIGIYHTPKKDIRVEGSDEDHDSHFFNYEFIMNKITQNSM